MSVWAFPNASRMGLVFKIRCSRDVPSVPAPQRNINWLEICLADSVLPAPDSPLQYMATQST